jgi:hypothetical protein
MDINRIPRFPLITQLICVLIAEALVAVGFFTPLPLLYVKTPLFSFDIPFGIAAVGVLFVPWVVHRARLDKLRSLARICHRCEKAMVTSGFALYEGEPICEQCAAYLENIEGRKLPRFVKGQSEHATT